MNTFVYPPPDAIYPRAVHKIIELYKNIYLLGKNIPKRDRFGIFTIVEKICLRCIELSIEASFLPKDKKIPTLQNLQIQIEVLKRFVRLLRELNVIKNKNYISIQEQLQEISKMAAGWSKYIQKRS